MKNMRMKRWKQIIVSAIVIITLHGCSSVMDKSVTDPLPVEELNSIVKEEPRFIEVYRLVEQKRDLIATEADKASWKELTYERFYRWMKKRFEAEQEWKAKFGNCQAKVDSISQYWKNYMKQNNQESFVSVKLVNIEKEVSEALWGGGTVVTGLYFILEVTPLKGCLDELDATFGLCEKGETPYYSYYVETKKNNINVPQKLCSSMRVKVAPFLTVEIEEDVKEMGLKELLKKYTFQWQANTLKQKGAFIRSPILDVPFAVTKWWEVDDDDKADKWEKKSAVELILGIEEYSTLSDYMKSAMAGDDSLSESFYELGE